MKLVGNLTLLPHKMIHVIQENQTERYHRKECHTEYNGYLYPIEHMDKYDRGHIQQIDKKSDKILFRQLFHSVEQTCCIEDHAHGKRSHEKRPEPTSEEVIIRCYIVEYVRELADRHQNEVHAENRCHEPEQRTVYYFFATVMQKKERRHKYRRHKEQIF